MKKKWEYSAKSNKQTKKKTLVKAANQNSIFPQKKLRNSAQRRNLK